MQLCEADGFELAVESGEIRGLELLPELKDSRRVFFGSIDGCKLGGEGPCRLLELSGRLAASSAVAGPGWRVSSRTGRRRSAGA